MEADWEFEADSAAPVIDAHWSGFVDLRLGPDGAAGLPEAQQCPALGRAVAKLNAPGSPVWTSKCDYFPRIEPGEFDPDEMDAPSGEAAYAVGCYIDVLPRAVERWARPADAGHDCQSLCGLLRAIPLRRCRVDLVIRRAAIAPGRMDLGVTAYITACGPTPADSGVTLGAALAAFADSISFVRLPADPI
jgi:hypothetical protein